MMSSAAAWAFPVAVLRGDDLDVGVLGQLFFEAGGTLLGVVSTGQAGDDGDLAGLAADLDVLGSFHDAGFLLAEQDLVDLVADAELIGKA